MTKLVAIRDYYMGIQSWAEVTRSSLLAVWVGVLNFLPSLVGALIVLIVGLIIASIFRWVVEQVVGTIRLDSLLRRTGLENYLMRGGLRLNSARFFGLLVYWFFVVVFVRSAAEILRLFGFSFFLQSVIDYIPSIALATIIMLVSVVVGNFARSVVRASVVGAKLHASKFLGTLSWWAIVVFGLLTALIQLGIAATIIQTVITGLIAMVALAGGIAFGLGGKGYAEHLLEKLRESTEG